MGLLKTFKEIIVENINESNESEYRMLKKVFKDNTDKLYEYLNNRGMIDDFMETIMDLEDEAELYGMIISSFVNVGDMERLRTFTLPAFDDLTIVGDDIIMTMSGREDLAQFFKEHGRNSSTDWIKGLLNGESYDNFNYDYALSQSEFENNIIDELNDKNLATLKGLLITNGLGLSVTYDGNNEILEEMIDHNDGKLGKDEFDEIFRTNSNIVDVLFHIDDFDNFKDNLQRIYDYSYESAIESENYNSIMSAIEGFFGDKGVTNDTGHKRKATRADGTTYTYNLEEFTIKVTDVYVNFIKWWIDSYGDDLQMWGDFEDALKEYCSDLDYRDSLTADFAEYADDKLLSDGINDTFNDYIDDY